MFIVDDTTTTVGSTYWPPPPQYNNFIFIISPGGTPYRFNILTGQGWRHDNDRWIETREPD